MQLLITDESELLMTNADILMLSIYATPEQIGIYFVLTRSQALAKFLPLLLNRAVVLQNIRRMRN